MKRVRGLILLGIAVALFATSFLFPEAAHAAPNIGPDPADFTASTRYGNTNGNTRTVDYTVATSAYNTILSTRLNIYLPSSSGTIVITNHNICYGTFRNGGRNYDQIDDGTANSSGNAVSFQIGASTQWGAWDSSSTCDSKTLTFNVSGAALDVNTGMYKYQLVVSANPSTDKYMNTFWVTAPSNGYVSQDSSLSTSSFALNQTSPIPAGSNPSNTQSPPSPYQDYTNYVVKFAPDCSLTTSSVAKSIEIFDDDNSGNWDVQPRPFLVKLVEIDNVTNAQTNVPLSASFPDGSGSASGPDASGYYTYATTANAKRIIINFTVKKGKKYQWLVDSVYYDNTLQFKVPYDNVYYYLGCAQPDSKLKAGMVATPATMAQEETATFTPSISVSSFRANHDVTCSITRTLYPAAGGTTSLGTQPCQTTGGATTIPVTGNGVITLASNNFSNASQATPGSRICDTITITSPSDPDYFAAASDNTAEACVRITKTPHVQFIGGDVWAGGGFTAVSPGTCTTAARITTAQPSATLSDGTYAGSGVAYGAFALGKITNFGSASYPLVGSLGDNWLFANTNTSNYGYFNGGEHCLNDYAAAYAAAPTLVGGGSINVTCNDASCGGGGSGAWRVTSSASFSGTVPVDRTKVYFVNGDATITGNITHVASYPNVDGVPSIVIIATGDIRVNAGVTQLDGIFISRGTFYTCYPKPEPATISTCNSKLTVNGSVVANRIDLHRTAGADGTTPATRKSAAEVFNLSPEVYLNNALNLTANPTITTVELRELPPRF